MTRAVAPLALALLLVLAGCGGFAGDRRTETTRVTPVEVPTTTERPDRFVAPGMTAERLVDPTALQRAHASRLANTSHRFREVVTRRGANGTLLARYVTLVVRNGSTVRYRYDGDRLDGRETWAVDRYVTADRVYTARTDGTATNYSVEAVAATGRRVPVSPDDYVASLTRVFGLLPIRVEETVRRGDRTRYYLETTAPRDVPPLRNATFVGAVTPEGVVDDYRVSYDVRRGGRPVTVTVTVSISDLGTATPERPGWTDRARNRTG
jgi:hypothetical protein